MLHFKSIIYDLIQWYTIIKSNILRNLTSPKNVDERKTENELHVYYFDLKKDIEENNRHENFSDYKHESESKTEESPSKKEESTPQKPLSAAAPKEEQPAPQKAPVTNTEKTVVISKLHDTWSKCLCSASPRSHNAALCGPKKEYGYGHFVNFHGAFTVVHSALNNWTKELSTD